MYKMNKTIATVFLIYSLCYRYLLMYETIHANCPNLRNLALKYWSAVSLSFPSKMCQLLGQQPDCYYFAPIAIC